MLQVRHELHIVGERLAFEPGLCSKIAASVVYFVIGRQVPTIRTIRLMNNRSIGSLAASGFLTDASNVVLNMCDPIGRGKRKCREIQRWVLETTTFRGNNSLTRSTLLEYIIGVYQIIPSHTESILPPISCSRYPATEQLGSDPNRSRLGCILIFNQTQ
ncbi:hypothetical protein BDZ91DRAFT_766474 [Kalaharituber pfeilii]|nr:hypothetical protein BDZ91DRAFT_766474 [Kalaharituber pfeilii]